MITCVRIRRFKGLLEAEIDVGYCTILIGPNNSGKTTALQALALWHAGLVAWLDRRDGGTARQRRGVAINRLELTSIPIGTARSLWYDLKTQFAGVTDGKASTTKYRIVVEVEGVSDGAPWSCPLEFLYSGAELIHVRPHKPDDESSPDDIDLMRSIARRHPVVYLPPMSGLADREFLKQTGEIQVLVGQGRTAEVLRNLCWKLFQDSPESGWSTLTELTYSLFGMTLDEPSFRPDRGELTLEYRETGDFGLDIASAGRGAQQVLLLLSYLLANPGSVVLLDEPDAHLEILRQRQIYGVLTKISERAGGQILAASHSEVLMKEASDRDVVIAFVGQPHRIDSQQSRAQVVKALESIPPSDYLVAASRGWMLYLEGATDLEVLKSLANRLDHPASLILENSPPVKYLESNRTAIARDHFFGLREGIPGLPGLAIFDRLEKGKLAANSPLNEVQWSRREIENYIATPESLNAFVEREYRTSRGILDMEPIERTMDEAQVDLPLTDFSPQPSSELTTQLTVMNELLETFAQSFEMTQGTSPWSPDVKVTDAVLDRLFELFYERLGVPQRRFKRDYHLLALTIPLDQIDPEVERMLDLVVKTASKAGTD